jgi:hypothetical protein
MKAINKWYKSLSTLNKISTWLFSFLALFVSLTVFLMILIPAADKSETQITAQEVGTIETLGAALLTQLGEETNKGEPRGVSVAILDEVLYVDFALDTDESKYLTRSTAWYAVDEIVQLVQLSGLADNLVVKGTLELIDKNGNSLPRDVVFLANFLDNQVPLLNTDRLIGLESWERAATSFYFHPALLD